MYNIIFYRIYKYAFKEKNQNGSSKLTYNKIKI